MPQEQANGFVLARMCFKEQEGAGMPEQVDVHRQARATLYRPLNLIGQLRRRFMSALSRREQVRGTVRHEKGSKFFQIELEKADDIRRQLELERLFVLDLASRNNEVHDSATCWASPNDVSTE